MARTMTDTRKLELIRIYISDTHLPNRSKHYALQPIELQAFDLLLKDVPKEAVKIAFDYGMAKGYLMAYRELEHGRKRRK